MHDRRRMTPGASGNQLYASSLSAPLRESVRNRTASDEQSAFQKGRPTAWLIAFSFVLFIFLTVRERDEVTVPSPLNASRDTGHNSEPPEPAPVIVVSNALPPKQESSPALAPSPQTEPKGAGPSEIQATPASGAPPIGVLHETTQFRLEPANNGNYYIKGAINGQSVTFLIDTGASWISIPDRLRWKLNLRKGRYVSVSTASGVVGNYETRVETLEFGPFRFENITGVLNPYAPNDIVLLGMSTLKEMDFAQTNGELVLSQSTAPGSAVVAEPSPALQRDLHLRRPVRECLGPSGVIDATTLQCMEGR